MKAISLIEPAANTCASLLTMRLRTTWAHVQLAVLHLCTESLQRMCFINQIISEKAIFNFTGYKSQSELFCLALDTRRTEKICNIEFYCLITNDELSLDHEQHFICISYTKTLNLHEQLDARAALMS